MKKSLTVVSGIAALGTAISMFVSTAAMAQATVLGVVSGDNEPKSIDNAFLELHQLLQPIDTAAHDVAMLIKTDKDPVSLDAFDIDEVGQQFQAAGEITDMNAWRAAASLIQTRGFVAYLEELRMMNSKLDRLVADSNDTFSNWANQPAEDRLTNTDAISAALATLSTSSTGLQNYAIAGMLVLKELTKRDHDITADAKREFAEA